MSRCHPIPDVFSRRSLVATYILRLTPYSRRLELLCACLTACKSSLDTFFSVPTTHYVSFSMNVWTSVTTCLIVLHMLSTFECKDWNLTLVQETIDFFDTINRFIETFEEVHRDTCHGRDNLFSQGARRMSCVKAFLQQSRPAPECAIRELFYTSSISPQAFLYASRHLPWDWRPSKLRSGLQ